VSDERIPEAVRPYFGHDKVALHGSGGMPASPPAPPGSTARKAGETAVSDALSTAGRAGRRPGDRPATLPPPAALPRRMRAGGERALMEASQRYFGPLAKAPRPHASAGLFWSGLFAPVYARIPWSIKRHMVSRTSGVRGWRT
jgi:hypothetical protein